MQFHEKSDLQAQIGPKSILERILTNFRKIIFFNNFAKSVGSAAGAVALQLLVTLVFCVEVVARR